MRRRNRGVLLVELLMAALLLGGATVACVSLAHANARRAQDTRDHAQARMAAIDLATILMDEPVETIAQAARSGAAGRAVLRGLWSAVIGAVPGGAAAQWRRDSDRVLARVRVASFAQVAAGPPGQLGLYRLTLAVRDGGAASTVSVLFRPSMRKPPRELHPAGTRFSLPRS